jgi:hypothetical protein
MWSNYPNPMSWWRVSGEWFLSVPYLM